jgi:triacylglycerol lipase
MRRLIGLRDLVHDAIDTISQLVQDTQDAAFEKPVKMLSKIDGLGEPARAADQVRRAVTGSVFAGIRSTNHGVRRIGDGAIAVVRGVAEGALGPRSDDLLANAIPPASLVWADVAQGALNAALGDFLHARSNGLATAMGVYQAGAPLLLERQAMTSALPAASDKLCIFVHGLAGTETAWWMGAREYHGDPAVSFGTLLARDHGYTSLYIRYNSGRHVSENGRELSELLTRLVAAYPTELRELVVVGHSMGGLVARSAAHYAQLDNRPWLSSLTHLLCIGSPHTGAVLEKSTNLLAGLLSAVEAAGTQVPAKILNARSAGIKDTRFGYVVDEDWTGHDPDALLTDRRHDIPLAPNTIYGFMAAAFLRDATHPMGALLGDLLVRLPSASGKAADPIRDIPFHIGATLHGLHHLALLNHPDVYRELVRFLALRTPADPLPR